MFARHHRQSRRPSSAGSRRHSPARLRRPGRPRPRRLQLMGPTWWVPMTAAARSLRVRASPRRSHRVNQLSPGSLSRRQLCTRLTSAPGSDSSPARTARPGQACRRYRSRSPDPVPPTSLAVPGLAAPGRRQPRARPGQALPEEGLAQRPRRDRSRPGQDHVRATTRLVRRARAWALRRGAEQVRSAHPARRARPAAPWLVRQPGGPGYLAARGRKACAR